MFKSFKLSFLLLLFLNHEAFSQETPIKKENSKIKNYEIKIQDSYLVDTKNSSNGDLMFELNGYTMKEILSEWVHPNRIGNISNFGNGLNERKYKILIKTEIEIYLLKDEILKELCDYFNLKMRFEELPYEANELLVLDTDKLTQSSKNLKFEVGIKLQKAGKTLNINQCTLNEAADFLTNQTSISYFYKGYLKDNYNLSISLDDIPKSLDDFGIKTKTVIQKRKIYYFENK